MPKGTVCIPESDINLLFCTLLGKIKFWFYQKNIHRQYDTSTIFFFSSAYRICHKPILDRTIVISPTNGKYVQFSYIPSLNSTLYKNSVSNNFVTEEIFVGKAIIGDMLPNFGIGFEEGVGIQAHFKSFYVLFTAQSTNQNYQTGSPIVCYLHSCF